MFLTSCRPVIERCSFYLVKLFTVERLYLCPRCSLRCIACTWGHYVFTLSVPLSVRFDVCPVPPASKASRLAIGQPPTTAVAQHADCAGESILMPTWTSPQARQSIPVQKKYNSPQGGQVHYTAAAAEASNDRRRSFRSSSSVAIEINNLGISNYT